MYAIACTNRWVICTAPRKRTFFKHVYLHASDDSSAQIFCCQYKVGRIWLSWWFPNISWNFAVNNSYFLTWWSQNSALWCRKSRPLSTTAWSRDTRVRSCSRPCTMAQSVVNEVCAYVGMRTRGGGGKSLFGDMVQGPHLSSPSSK
jgi:hypothetical protein